MVNLHRSLGYTKDDDLKSWKKWQKTIHQYIFIFIFCLYLLICISNKLAVFRCNLTTSNALHLSYSQRIKSNGEINERKNGPTSLVSLHIVLALIARAIRNGDIIKILKYYCNKESLKRCKQRNCCSS